MILQLKTLKISKNTTYNVVILQNVILLLDVIFLKYVVLLI